MCVCVNPRTPEPVTRDSAEGEPYIDLLVGDPSLRYTVRKLDLRGSPVFEAQLYGPLAPKNNTIEIPDIDSRAFEEILRHLKGCQPAFRSEDTAVNTLYAAHKYLLPDLVRQCTEYLVSKLQPDTALAIFNVARRYSSADLQSSPRGSPDRLPSAPPESDDPPVPPSLIGWSDVLLTRCLEFIDLHGDILLSQEAFEDLPPDALKEILSRDTLRCHELTVLAALQRWGNRQCLLQHLPNSPKLVREVLGDKIFLTRIPLLTADEFIGSVVQSDLLSHEETKFFSALIARMPCCAPPGVKPYLQRMQTPRVSQVKVTEPLNAKSSDTKRHSKGWGRKKTPKKEKTETSPNSKRCSWSCVGDRMVDALVCFFD